MLANNEIQLLFIFSWNNL